MSYLIEIPKSRRRFSSPGVLDMVNGMDSVDQRAIRRVGLRGFQPGTTASLLAIWELRRRDLVFYDVGANGGLYTWLCQATHPESHVYAFEPVPDVARVVDEVCERNGLRAKTEAIALSDQDGEATLFLSAKSDASNSLTPGFKKSKGEIVVPRTTLDRYVADGGRPPNVLKIDVEQHEEEVLRGGIGVIEAQRPDLVVELLPRDPVVTQRVRDLLTSLGYVGHQIDPGSVVARQEADALQDWVFFHGKEPTSYRKLFNGWLRAVAQCRPGAAGKK
jgi:FkbM family methyltransferase